MNDALERERVFAALGADGIMIHSCKKDLDEIARVCDEFRTQDKYTPIVVVPSSFNVIAEEVFAELGVNIGFMRIS